MKSTAPLLFSMLFILSLLSLLSLVSVANAQQITITVPESVDQGVAAQAHFDVSTTSLFAGFVHLSYANTNSSTTTVAFTNTSFSGSGPFTLNHTWSITGIAPGAYSVLGMLTDENNITLAIADDQGTVNSSYPLILSTSPSGELIDDSVVLVITTSEPANCKYDTDNVTYDNMSLVFDYTGNLTHNETIDGISQGEHTFYIHCKDNDDRLTPEPAIVNFNIELPPTAEISLSKESPLGKGTIEVTVVSSKSLPNAPVLEYAFNDAPTAKHPISLQGEDSLWRGYLIITDEDDNKAGTFYFSGTDNSGITGEKVTKGKLFLVDTTKPPQPLNIESRVEPDGSITIDWYYEGEDYDYFQVFRSTSSGLDYIDYYSDTNASKFTDKSTVDKVTYYYRVAAVDFANNVGPLSPEVFATSINKISTGNATVTTDEPEEEPPKVLPPHLVVKVNDQLKTIDNTLVSLYEARSSLEGITDIALVSSIEELGLKAKLNEVESQLESQKQQLNDLKANYRTDSELDQELSKLDLEFKKLQKTTPKNLALIEQAELIQTTTEEDIVRAAEELFAGTDISEDQKKSYISANKKSSKEVQVEGKVSIIKIEYLDGTTAEKTFIQKKIFHNSVEPLEDVIVIEIIPKEAAQSTNEIEFITDNPEILKEDPVIKWGFFSLSYDGQTIKYIINKKITTDSAKKTKTVALLGLNQIEPSSSVTGYSVFDSMQLGTVNKIFIGVGFIVVLLLGGYYTFFVRKPGERATMLARRFKNSAKTKPQKPQKELYSDSYFLLSNIQDHLKQAHTHLDKNEHSLAASLYPRIDALYKELPPMMKKEVLTSCFDLHKRLNTKK